MLLKMAAFRVVCRMAVLRLSGFGVLDSLAPAVAMAESRSDLSGAHFSDG